MDTPERSNVVATPTSGPEDSPVYNFLNNLSPIKAVKSVHTLQIFQPLNYTSACPIFTSPHINLPKDSRFLVRNHVSESTRIEGSEEVKDISIKDCNIDFDKSSHCTTVARESCTTEATLVKAAVELYGGSSQIHNDLVRSDHYHSVNPNHNPYYCYATRCDQNICEDNNHQHLLVQDALEKRKSLFSTENELQGNPDHDKVKEMSDCDWDPLISDEDAVFMLFDSHNDSENHEEHTQLIANFCITSSAPLAPKPAEVGSSSQAIQLDNEYDPFPENMKRDPSENFHEDILEKTEADHTSQIFSSCFNNETTTVACSQNLGNETHNCVSLSCKVEPQQRGIRGRCLVFEVPGVSRKHTQKDLSCRSSLILNHNNNAPSDDAYLIPRQEASPPPCALPGIGLHLNALATISKDALPPSRQLVAVTHSFDPLHPALEEDFSQVLATVDTPVVAVSELQDIRTDICDDSQASTSENYEDKSQNSPKKHKLEDSEDNGCKRCSCKRSKCMKLYCDCFGSGVYCSEPCSCQGCLNTHLHEETVLATRKQIESRNPLAFAPKVIQVPVPVQENGEKNKTPSSARHKRGCNCKKSSCLKKYCECFQAGVGCSVSCRCEGCKNAFGKKNGSMEFDQEREGALDCGNREQPVDNPHKDDYQISRENHMENPILVTPLLVCRPSSKDVVSSGKPPRSITLPGGYSRLNISQTLTKCQFLLPQPKSGNHMNADIGEVNEFVRENALLTTVVKTSSPNSKRVSSPHHGTGQSPNRKISRRLILKSIPSFPTLNSDASGEHHPM